MTTTKDSLVEQLRDTIEACSRDEDLPFWGEVFVLLHELRKVPFNEMPLYELHPTGEVRYDRARRRFMIRIPDMDIFMKHDELADAIVKKGLFHPKPRPVPEGLAANPDTGQMNQEGDYL